MTSLQHLDTLSIARRRLVARRGIEISSWKRTQRFKPLTYYFTLTSSQRGTTNIASVNLKTSLGFLVLSVVSTKIYRQRIRIKGIRLENQNSVGSRKSEKHLKQHANKQLDWRFESRWSPWNPLANEKHKRNKEPAFEDQNCGRDRDPLVTRRVLSKPGRVKATVKIKMRILVMGVPEEKMYRKSHRPRSISCGQLCTQEKRTLNPIVKCSNILNWTNSK